VKQFRIDARSVRGPLPRYRFSPAHGGNVTVFTCPGCGYTGFITLTLTPDGFLCLGCMDARA
jgi:hypothetical protein